MHCLVVEDSRLARQELVRQLTILERFDEIRSATNTEEANEAITEGIPDVLFLDIHLPGKNAFEWLTSLDVVPRVIFTTAYAEYAVRSFEYNTVDYLLKPIDPIRLRQAIDKLALRLPRQGTRLPGDQVFVREGERCWFVPLQDIRLFESVGNYARLYLGEHRPLVHKSLNALEEVLDKSTFYRINRQQILNLTYVERIDLWFSDTLKIALRTGEEVEVSRRQASRIKKLFSL